MNYQDEYRKSEIVQGVADKLCALVAGRKEPMTFMEVCGTHTMAIYRFGLRTLLPPEIRLISGPGCPVCVTPNAYLDRAVALSRLPDLIITTFGDMMRVPGSSSSLLEERAKGADIRIVYSPLDAVAMAANNPEKRVVFLGVGFETTAPAIAASILVAERKKLQNYFVLISHKTIPLAMQLLTADPDLRIDGYICPAHVSAIIGIDPYRPLAEKFNTPCVITGFEPADVLQGVLMLAKQIHKGRAIVEIQYNRVVRSEGNIKALAVMNRLFTISDAVWRGIGVIPGSGLQLKHDYLAFDAGIMLPVEVEPTIEQTGRCCGNVLKGKISPFTCPLFANSCTPETPVGACMVSSEGTCAAAYKYGR